MIPKKMIRFIQETYLSWIRYLDGPIGEHKRYVYYKRRLCHLGKNVVIDTGVFFIDCQYISIYDNVYIDKNCIIAASPENLDISSRIIKENRNPDFQLQRGELKIGDNCHIGHNCLIYACLGVDIEKNCVLSTGVKLYSLTSMAYNPYDRTEITSVVPYNGKSPSLIGPIVIKENSWIGIDSIISPGVSIGKNSFVRSNSIVMNSCEENSYLAGDPAKFIRHRFEGKNAL